MHAVSAKRSVQDQKETLREAEVTSAHLACADLHSGGGHSEKSAHNHLLLFVAVVIVIRRDVVVMMASHIMLKKRAISTFLSVLHAQVIRRIARRHVADVIFSHLPRDGIAAAGGQDGGDCWEAYVHPGTPSKAHLVD